MSTKIPAALPRLNNAAVEVSAVNTYKMPGAATIQLLFSDGSRLRAEYWRVTKERKERVSSFDHEQKYGLPAPIDAIRVLQNEVRDKTVKSVQLDTETGDLLFQFAENLKLQVFGFTGYEIWEIEIYGSKGGQYSNYAKEVCPFTPDDFASA